MATGVSLAHTTLINDGKHPVIQHLLQALDITPITYKAWDSGNNFMVEDPSAPATDLPNIVLSLPPGTPLVLSQVGYPSGYLPPRQAGDNSTIFKQYAFFHTLFSMLAGPGVSQEAHKTLRFGRSAGSGDVMGRGAVSVAMEGVEDRESGHGQNGLTSGILRVLVVDMLVDVPQVTCEQLFREYTIPAVFLEDLCSTGLYAEDGTQKPALDSVVHGFVSLSAAAEAASGGPARRADARRLAAAL